MATEMLQRNEGHAEGPIAKAIENFTAEIPSDVFLTTAIGAIGVSWGMHLMGMPKAGLFVGQWVPTILIMGVYNKLVKLHGSEAPGKKAA
jgi:hypothetical protein